MPRIESDNRSGPRYLATLEVKAEWDEPSGTHIVAEGTTENVGPEGTLVHLPRQLPQVGSRVRLEVAGESGEKLQVIAEVLRIERHPGHPLAALQLLGETDEWRGLALVHHRHRKKLKVKPKRRQTTTSLTEDS
jgi:hypothetical protein